MGLLMLDITQMPSFMVDPRSRPIAASSVSILKPPAHGMSDRDVCLFLTYAPNGSLGSGIYHLAASLQKQGMDVLLCLVTDGDGCPDGAIFRAESFFGICHRRNGGYDFAMWAATLKALPSLWTARRLYFVNDSILGPLFDIGDMIARIRASSSDFIALTANHIDVYHAQSYFFVLQGRSLRNEVVRTFWAEMPEYSSKTLTIRNCEQIQLPLYTAAGLAHDILFKLEDVSSSLSEEKRKRFNPTHNAWRELINAGFPFIKADLIHLLRIRAELPAHISRSVRDVLRQQLDEIVLARTTSSSRAQHTHLMAVKKLIGEDLFFSIRSWIKRRKLKRRIF